MAECQFSVGRIINRIRRHWQYAHWVSTIIQMEMQLYGDYLFSDCTGGDGGYWRIEAAR